MQYLTIALLVVSAFFAGCGGKVNIEQFTDVRETAYEAGLRAGYADKKAYGYCDHPFPRDEKLFGNNNQLDFIRFETGYYKACAIAREVVVKKVAPPKRPQSAHTSQKPRCEAL
jgi:hypothetical protein